MNIKAGEFKEIENIARSIKRKLENVSTPKSKEANKEVSEKVEIKYNNSNLRNLMNKVKNTETEYSKNQIYLNSLQKSEELLNSNKSVKQIAGDLVALLNNTKFNNKKLLKALLPDNINLYTEDKIKELSSMVEKEITKTGSQQNNLKKELNKIEVALENINASRSDFNIKELNNLNIPKNNLHNIDNNIVASLIKK